jgi:hypothetical protein
MWMYIPESKSCRSARGLADSILASDWLSHLLEPSATWRGKLRSRQFWRRALAMTAWTQPLFGRTFGPSTANRGAAEWVASWPDIRASRSVALGIDGAGKTLGTCGRTSRGSSARLGRSGSSLKTSPVICGLDFARSHASYDAWVTRLRVDCLRRRKSARHIGGSGYSCWPTPDHNAAALGCLTDSGYQKKLSVEANNWRTPLATDAFAPNRKRIAGIGRYQLREEVQVGCFLRGRKIAGRGAKSLEPMRRLNPRFVEWLMGFPLGWTESAPLGMRLFRGWQRSHGEPCASGLVEGVA